MRKLYIDSFKQFYHSQIIYPGDDKVNKHLTNIWFIGMKQCTQTYLCPFPCLGHHDHEHDH